jgi:beta-phosphoglucomutase-like phosphatase (HAD superfamily)
MSIADFDVILFDSLGVTLVQSPRYLQEEIVDEVDAMGRIVIDEQRFWQRTASRLRLDEAGVAALQSRIAAKYCRNLNVWAQLPGLAADARLALSHPGPAAMIPHWAAYALTDRFSHIIVAGSLAIPPTAPEYYARVARDLDCPPRRMLVVDDEAEPILAAKDAGCPTYRYGSAYGLMQLMHDA